MGHVINLIVKRVLNYKKIAPKTASVSWVNLNKLIFFNFVYLILLKNEKEIEDEIEFEIIPESDSEDGKEFELEQRKADVIERYRAVLNKLRKISGKFHQSNLLTDALREKQPLVYFYFKL